MYGQQIEAVEKSGAADMIDQLDQLAVQEESINISAFGDAFVVATRKTSRERKCKQR